MGHLRSILWTLLLLAGFWSAGVWAQEVLGPLAPPWRPIPEFPAILWYTELDESPEEARRLFLNGDIVGGDAPALEGPRKGVLPPWQNDRYILLRRMPRSRDGTRRVCFTIDLMTTPVRVPDGRFDPKDVFLRFCIWASEPGEVVVMAKAGTRLEERLKVPRPRQWCPLKVSFGSLEGKDERMRPNALTQEIRFAFEPSGEGRELPVACIDKVMLCAQVPPDRAAAMLTAWHEGMSRLRKTLVADGLAYGDQAHVAMRTLVQRSRHRGPVLVFLPWRCADGDPAARLADAAREARLRGVAVEVACDPRTERLTKLEDFRAFLPHLLSRRDPRSVIVLLSKEDAQLDGREPRHLRTILERLLASNRLPLIGLPPAGESDRKLLEYRQAASRLCAELNVPLADPGFALGGVARPFAEGTLTAEGLKGLGAFLAGAFRHLQEATGMR